MMRTMYTNCAVKVITSVLKLSLLFKCIYCFYFRSGPLCDCSIGDENASAELMAQCREPNATRTIACSGAGDCLCGKCECDRGFNGKYCQCKSCDISM